MILYIYSLLGLINNTIINDILYYICKCIICIGLVYNIIYNIVIVDLFKLGFILYKINYIVQYIILNINLNKLIEDKTLENTNINNILSIFQIIIFLLSGCFVYGNIICIDIQDIGSNIFEFIGIYIYLNSLLIFIILLIKIYQYIKKVRDDIHIKQDENTDNILYELYNEIITYKYIIGQYITNFNYIFNFFTIVNIVSICIIYENYNDLTDYQIIYFYVIVILFLFIDMICICLILYISYIRGNILNELYSPIFINKYIKRNDLDMINYKYGLNIQVNDLNVDNNILYHKINENGTSIDWLILYNSLNSKWIDFNLFGIEIHSFDSITKIMIYSLIIYKLLI